MESTWATCGGEMYNLEEGVRQLGLGTDGVTTYFSAGCTKVCLSNPPTFAARYFLCVILSTGRQLKWIPALLS
jgi:hypothetical protein